MAGQVISRLTSSGGNDAGVHVISSSFYGICNTAANEKAKVVVISNHNINQIKLVKGMTLNVKFINDNTATEIPTLAIYSNQSNTDAENPTAGTGLTVPYNIYVKEEDTILPLKPKWSAGSIVTFVYDEFRDNEEINHPRWIKINSSNEELIDRVNELDSRTQVAVQEVDMEYAPSQSNTETPTSGWETSISTYTPGWYIWQRTKTLNVGSSTPSYSDPICITGRDGTPGPAGASAYQYSLLCSPSALVRNMNVATPVNVPSAITFSATYAEGSNTPSAYLGYFDVRQTVDGTNWITLTSGSGQSSITCTPTTAAVAVKCTLSSQADTNIHLDTQTVPIIETGKDGEDAYTAYLTNDNHSFAATDDNAAVTASVSSQFIVMKGNTSVTATISTITCWPDTALEDGLTVTWANNTFTASVSPSLSVTDYPTGGYLYITASAENQNFEKQFSWLLVPAGADGTNATNFRSISLYKRVAPNTGNPTRPDNELIYYFNTDILSPIDSESSNITPTYDGWYRQIPEGSDPCWTIMANALASTTAATDTIAIDDWTSPVMLVKDGEDGLNNATLYLYQRNNSDVEPSLPDEDLTYIFSTGLSPTYQIGNWYGSVSAATITAGDEHHLCWMTTAPAISTDNSVLVTSGSWTDPVIYINPARGISDITEKYLKTTASTGVTTATSGWIIPSTTTPIPNPDATNRYIWNYEITTYTDGDTDETTPHIVATYGIDGQSIYSVIDYYKTTTVASLPTKREIDGGPSGSGENGWMTPSTTTPVPQVDKNNKYLWNYERTEYRNPTSTASTAVRLIGAYGDDGIHPTKFVEQKILWEYDDSDLDTHPAPGDNNAWEDGDVIWESNKFIWARTKIIWSDNNPPTHPHITYTDPILANTYNSISEIAAAASETANDAMDMATSASTSAESAVTSASQALASASTAIEYANAAELAASAAVSCANAAHRAAVSAQTSASLAQASADLAITAAWTASEAASAAVQSASIAYDNAASAVTSAGLAFNAAASAVACATAAFNAAASAQTSASQAAQSANSAALSASAAESSASTASAAAVNAENSALLASQRADLAESAASAASAAAFAAVQSASVAITSASLAVQSASIASTSASQAAQNASAAVTSASLAAQSASAANIAANSALTQLSIIEDVAGTLDWIGKHGSYVKTTDTTVQEGTIYFEKDNNNNYTPVINPEGNPSEQELYILDITDSQSNYIMAHLAVTSAGLWILPSTVEEYSAATDTATQSGVVYYTRSGSIGNYTYTVVPTPTGNPKIQGWYTRTTDKASGYKTLLSESGMSIYDNSGTIVATYGEGISFDSNRSFTIGDSSASIVFNGNGQITISGSGVNIGSTVSIGSLSNYTTKSDVDSKIANTAVLWYAECNTAASEATKTASISPTTTAFTLKTGITVNVKFANTNAVTPSDNLKLSVNGTTAKPIKYLNNGSIANLPAANYLRTNQIVAFTYDGSYWVADFSYNLDTIDRTQHSNQIKAAAAITAGKIIAGTSTGYKELAANLTFDLSYPILYASAAITSGSTATSTYEIYPNVNPGTTFTVQGAAVNKIMYLKGTISGNTFTVASQNAFTCNIPNSEDNNFYIPLGILSSDSTSKLYFTTSKQLYAYIDGGFRQVDPTGIVATQRIYYRSDSSVTFNTTNNNLPTNWIISTANTYNRWTLKVPPLAASSAENATKYPYLYTCEQRKRLDGTINYTTILLDDSNTIIDGGNIITGSITANAIEAGTITAGLISAGTITAGLISAGTITAGLIDAASINASGMLTIGSMTNSAASSILNSNIIIGGKNLLGNTENRSGSIIVTNSGAESTFGSIGRYNDSVLLYSFVDYDGYSNAISCATSTSTGNRGVGWYTKVGEIRAGETYTFSCRIKCSIATNIHMHTAWRNGSATAGYTGWTSAGTKAISADTWTDYSYTFVPASNAQLDWEFFVAICITGSSSGATYQVAHAKLEKGTEVTDWSPAPEELQSNAIKRTQRIYYRTSSSMTSWTMPTTWLATTSDVFDQWTCKVPRMTANADGTGTKYLYLYTCEQREMGNGALEYTTVLLDDSTTIIDGGTIITGSITANKLNATDINASNMLTVGSLETALKNDITNGVTAYNRATAYRGVCSASTTTATKVVTCDNFPGLSKGIAITVYNTTAQTATAALSLKINSGDTKSIYVNGNATSDTNRLLWAENSSITYVYDGTYWRVGDNPGGWYGTTCTISENTAAKTTTVDQIVLFKGTTLSIPMTYSNTSTAATLKISSGNNTSLSNTSIYYGTSTTIPTRDNGYAWLPNSELILTYDGKFWRTGHQTFINGGNILTNTITAAQINADDLEVNAANIKGTLTASQIQAGSISIGTHVATADQNLILNDNIQIGGRNLLKAIPENYDPTAYSAYKINLTENLIEGETYTLQLWNANVYHSAKTAENTGIWVYWGGGNIQLINDWKGSNYFTQNTENLNEEEILISHADYLSKTFTITSSQASGSGATNPWLILYNSVGNATGTRYMWIDHWKLEKGNKATDWTLAPEDIQSDIETVFERADNNMNERSRQIYEKFDEYTSLNEFYEKIASKLDSQYLVDWIHGDDNGLSLGKFDPENPNTILAEARLDSTKLAFLIQGVLVATYGGLAGMSVPHATVENILNIGDYAWIKRTANNSNHLSLKYIGGNI